MKTFIVLFPIDKNTRKVSERANNKTYKSTDDFVRTTKGENRIVTDLENFVYDHNNGDYALDLYWISYINIEEHER